MKKFIMKKFLSAYFEGFFKGFNCIFTVWNKPDFSKIENNEPKKTIEEMNREMTEKAWLQTCLDFRRAFDNVTARYGYKNE